MTGLAMEDPANATMKPQPVIVVLAAGRGSRFGGAAESIGRQKQSRLQAAISLYLANLAQLPACRIDAVLFESGKPPQWLQNIFEAL